MIDFGLKVEPFNCFRYKTFIFPWFKQKSLDFLLLVDTVKCLASLSLGFNVVGVAACTVSILRGTYFTGSCGHDEIV